ncbi:hypothetical protein D3C81_1684210 [compost metagenome]
MVPALTATLINMPMPHSRMMMAHGTLASAAFSSPTRNMSASTTPTIEMKVGSMLVARRPNTEPAGNIAAIALGTMIRPTINSTNQSVRRCCAVNGSGRSVSSV